MKSIRLIVGFVFTSLIMLGNPAWAQDMMCPEDSLAGKRMVINLGNSDVDKAILAFDFALANRGCEAEVIVFLSEKGTIFAVDTTPRVGDEKLSVQTRIERFLDNGGRVLLCVSCLPKNFGLDPTQEILIDGIELFNRGLLNLFYSDGRPTAYFSW